MCPVYAMSGSHLFSTKRKSASAAMKPASKAVMLGGSGSGISSPSASQSPHNKMSETNRGKKRGMKSKPLAKAPRPAILPEMPAIDSAKVGDDCRKNILAVESAHYATQYMVHVDSGNNMLAFG